MKVKINIIIFLFFIISRLINWVYQEKNILTRIETRIFYKYFSLHLKIISKKKIWLLIVYFFKKDQNILLCLFIWILNYYKFRAEYGGLSVFLELTGFICMCCINLLCKVSYIERGAKYCPMCYPTVSLYIYPTRTIFLCLDLIWTVWLPKFFSFSIYSISACVDVFLSLHLGSNIMGLALNIEK